jgi:hypothetical protein
MKRFKWEIKIPAHVQFKSKQLSDSLVNHQAIGIEPCFAYLQRNKDYIHDWGFCPY